MTAASPARDALAARILAWMDGSLVGMPPEPFDDLALALHRHQHAHDAGLRRLIATPADSVDQIPAVPVEAFKHGLLGTVPADRAGAVFRTSGTTGGGRGTHALVDARVYDHGAQAWARRCVPDRPDDVVSLVPDPAEVPDSSLGHMVAGFAPADRRRTHLVAGRVDRAGLAHDLQRRTAPVFLAATAFALADALEADLPPLPAGSVVMVTGGFKGRRVAWEEQDLVDLVHARLGVRRVVSEYGMTELSSQLWGHPGGPLLPPPWLRVQAIDPTTAAPLGPGRRGQLRFLDLANLDSTLCIDTLDAGTVHGDGSVTLHGRLEEAALRGCSLPVEEAGYGGATP